MTEYKTDGTWGIATAAKVQGLPEQVGFLMGWGVWPVPKPVDLGQFCE